MTVKPITELKAELPPELTAINPTIDSEMKTFILECAEDGMTAQAIRDELHRLGFAWLDCSSVAALIEANRNGQE